ncbi:MAG: alcohol dehydrogenase catalytic domain-containing protein, partial [Halioglobus sp.]|nr:alcohol dehydrogenase catalytic domain-containing protein [Halioglobus sp.]
MKAAVFEEVGESIKIYDDIDVIEPRAGEVRVKVHYCSVCHSDLSIIDGSLPAFGHTILGHEASGVVESVGSGVTSLAVGDHVVMTPVPPCGTCYFCVRGETAICSNNTSLTSFALADGNTGLSRKGEVIYRGMGVGAFAEYVVTPVNGAVKIAPDVPLELAGLLGCALQTGIGAVLNTADVESGATVAVMGLGGVGISAVQGAKLAGASIILASDPVTERRELAKTFGATHVIDPLNEDLPQRCLELTHGIGMDYAFETAGVTKLVETGIAITRAGGTTVAVGAPPLDQGIEINHFVMFSTTEKKLCGCLMGSCNSLRD